MHDEFFAYYLSGVNMQFRVTEMGARKVNPVMNVELIKQGSVLEDFISWMVLNDKKSTLDLPSWKSLCSERTGKKKRLVKTIEGF